MKAQQPSNCRELLTNLEAIVKCKFGKFAGVFFPANLLHWSGAARKTLNKFSRKANCITLVLQKEEASESEAGH